MFSNLFLRFIHIELSYNNIDVSQYELDNVIIVEMIF